MTLTAAISGLENGYHNFFIHAADDEGIYRDYNGSFYVQAVWPVVSTLSAENVGQTSLSLSWTPAKGSRGYRISLASDLDDIRTNTEFRATLKTIAAAGGHSDITMDDLVTFLSGDAGSRKGLEGTIAGILAQKSKLELAQLLMNKQKQTAVLHVTLVLLLGDPDAYKLSSILSQLDVTPGGLLAMAQNFRQKLQHDEPVARAITVAYIRSITVETVKITADGKKHNYSLKAHGIELPSAILKWSKVSGDGAVTVRANGAVSIPNQTAKGTAVIQATLVNPYGGKAKVIFQKEVTLVNGGSVL
ncbi:hypothetical protein [Paenibacillus sp. LPE1-1-1.1]|uniref:hypothetical protein n=1 Tax=Paenibacillus sp. LPE1-1-1.1 TaxID=3135230 RepID=UPI00343B17FA